MQKSQVLDIYLYSVLLMSYCLVFWCSSTPLRIYILSRCTSQRISRDRETHRYKNSFAVHSAAWRKHSDSENRARSWRWVRPRAGRSGAWRTTSWSGYDDDIDEYNDHNDFVIRIPNGSGASKEAAKTYNGLSVPRMVRILRPSTSGSSKVGSCWLLKVSPNIREVAQCLERAPTWALSLLIAQWQWHYAKLAFKHRSRCFQQGQL